MGCARADYASLIFSFSFLRAICRPVLYGPVLLIALMVVPTAQAADNLFDISAVGTSTTVNAGSNSLLGLVENLTNNNQQFSPLKSQDFNASVNYAGIPNAIKLSQSIDTTGARSVTVQVPSVGLNKTFNSADGDLTTQIKDFLKKDGLADITAFQAYVNRSSIAGVIDGNPMALTALLQDAGYQEFALHESPADMNGKMFTSDDGHSVSRYWVDAGVLDIGGTTGTYYTITLASEYYFNDFIGLGFTVPFRYETLKSADIFMGGAILSLPINIMPAKGGHFSWRVTPAATGGSAGSQDFVSGGLTYGAEIASSFSFNINGYTLTLADSAGYDHGADISVSGYHFNTQVNQAIFKNGLQLQKNWGRFFVDASGTWTNFLHSAYISGYFTPEIGAGFVFGANKNWGFRAGYTGNFGNKFNSSGGNLLLYYSN